MLNLDSIVSYREDIDTTDIDGDKVMMDLEKGQYFALNSVGSRIWEEIQSPVKISEVVNTLSPSISDRKSTRLNSSHIL